MATTKEYYEYVMECLSKAGDVTVRRMMGEYCVYYNGKLIGDICDNRFLVKKTPSSEKLLEGGSLEYPYEGSKTLMYVLEELEEIDFIKQLLEGLFYDLPLKK